MNLWVSVGRFKIKWDPLETISLRQETTLTSSKYLSMEFQLRYLLMRGNENPAFISLDIFLVLSFWDISPLAQPTKDKKQSHFIFLPSEVKSTNIELHMQKANLKAQIPSGFIITSFSIHFLAWGIFWKTRGITSIRFCGEELQNGRKISKGK